MSNKFLDDDGLAVVWAQTEAKIGQATSGLVSSNNPVFTGSLSLNRAANSSIGEKSTALGNNCVSSGDGATAEGTGTTASGTNAHAEGQGTTASGAGSHAEGSNTQATGASGHTEGAGTQANGACAHAEGYATYAVAANSHTEGTRTNATGSNSHAEGESCYARATNSHAEGEGTDVKSDGTAGHAEGRYSQVYGRYAHAEGDGCSARGEGSHAEGVGSGTTDQAYAGHAEGASTVSNQYAHAEGAGNASGLCSHAENSGMVSGQDAHAEGFGVATGYVSHAEGYSTYAASQYQHVQGKYNIVDDSDVYADIVGNGDYTERSNAYTLDWNGNGVYAGKVTVGAGPTNNMDVATKQYVDAHTLPAATISDSGKTLMVDSNGDWNLSATPADTQVTQSETNEGASLEILLSNGQHPQTETSIVKKNNNLRYIPPSQTLELGSTILNNYTLLMQPTRYVAKYEDSNHNWTSCSMSNTDITLRGDDSQNPNTWDGINTSLKSALSALRMYDIVEITIPSLNSSSLPMTITSSVSCKFNGTNITHPGVATELYNLISASSKPTLLKVHVTDPTNLSVGQFYLTENNLCFNLSECSFDEGVTNERRIRFTKTGVTSDNKLFNLNFLIRDTYSSSTVSGTVCSVDCDYYTLTPTT